MRIYHVNNEREKLSILKNKTEKSRYEIPNLLKTVCLKCNGSFIFFRTPRKVAGRWFVNSFE